MGDYGMVVSKAGTSVYSTNPRDLIFSSKFTVVKIITDGLGTLSVPTGGAYGTITHNLGFPPLTILYTEFTPGSNRWYFGVPSNPGENTYIDSDISGTATSVFHLVNTTGSTKSIKYRYFVLGDLG